MSTGTKRIEKTQKIENRGPFSYLVNPNDGTPVKVVPPDEFSRLEYEGIETDYCTIIGDTIYISTKAKYDYVLIKYPVYEKSEAKFNPECIVEEILSKQPVSYEITREECIEISTQSYNKAISDAMEVVKLEWLATYGEADHSLFHDITNKLTDLKKPS